MLQVTEAAAETLKEMRTQVGAGDDAGARIQPAGGDSPQPSLTLGFSEEPSPGDRVVEQSDLKVYVPESLSAILDEATLDVEETPQGRMLTLR